MDIPSQEEISDNPVVNRIRDRLTRVMGKPKMLRGFQRSILNAYRRWSDHSEELHDNLWESWIYALREEEVVAMNHATQEGMDVMLRDIFGVTVMDTMLFWGCRMVSKQNLETLSFHNT